jgi:hypothetical protein
MKQKILMIALTVFMLSACSKDDTDMEKPVIDFSADDSFPNNCDTLWLGEAFNFRATFTDNSELGSYSIEIHENFDHHSHSTEETPCELMPEKEPVNPFEFLQDYMIPAGLSSYEADLEITIPEGNNDGFFDEGDYDISISLTDKEGWSAQKIISLKLLRR